MKLTDYRLFGRTGVNVSPFVLGGRAFGRQADRETSIRIIDRALDVVFTPEDDQRIDSIIPPGSHVSPFYDANFGPHPHRW